MKHATNAVRSALEAAAALLSARDIASRPLERPNERLRWGAGAHDGVQVPTANGRTAVLSFAAEREAAVAMVRPTLRVLTGSWPQTDLVAQTTATGLWLLVVLRGPGAPQRFPMPMRLAEHLTTEMMPSGAVDVVDQPTGSTVGRFLRPWGCDAMYRQLPVEFALTGSTVTLQVQHHQVHYPALATCLYTDSSSATRFSAGALPSRLSPLV
ncbi:hypothetical protein [Actinomadura hibisca]|uniref:hypothetical protein n=1 Tax=Actinomadura hibisca TaxID=68565 RepID=UPI000831036E|nr:hypothetical protein [Actinomadura hibisca]